MSSIADLLRLYAQQFEDQHAPQNMTIALREASSLIEKQFDAIKGANEVIKEANVNIDRLRAALERIADTDPDEGTQWFHEVARAALNEGKTND
jgi:hypothetical protein